MPKTAKRKTPAARAKPDAVKTLLVELGTEELPPKALRRISEAFGAHFYNALAEAQLVAGDGTCQLYAAPRRLAVHVPAVRVRQPDREVERRGPALASAFDADGAPTKAALGFAGSCGVAVEKLQRLETDKGAYLVHRQIEKGQPARKLIPALLEDALKKLPIPKRMRWGDLEAEFVRPVHWLVLLHGRDVINTTLLSVKAGNQTRGHRFHYPKTITLPNADRYAPLLETRGSVMPEFNARRGRIRAEVMRLAKRKDGEAVIDPDLLDEVTALVEWPVPLLGNFDAEFLEVPAEALTTTMGDNQKYFPVVDKRGKLLPHFITVANIKSKSPAKVRQGNERVLRARFADARFFWDTDRRQRLDSRIDNLKDVVFHVKLGSLYDKTERVRVLAGAVAEALGAERALAERAAQLSKTDLVTGMVGEFPELQGTMGRYYARHDGEHAEVVAAMAEQYLPRFAGDELPQTATGAALAVADRLDTLTGIFGVGELPTGDKDPFGLRRAALGALRIMVERELDLNLVTLLEQAVAGYDLAFEPGGVVDQLYAFMMERLRAYYYDAGVGADVFEAVTACRPERPADFDRRVRAVTAFRGLAEADSLTSANKRIRNILRQAGEVPAGVPDAALLQEPAERDLAGRLEQMEAAVAPALASGDYTGALKQMAALRTPVDKFFDDVMVMVDDPVLRTARLQLLNRLGDLFLRIADLSRLQG